jgi:hypothetical protein
MVVGGGRRFRVMTWIVLQRDEREPRSPRVLGTLEVQRYFGIHQ